MEELKGVDLPGMLKDLKTQIQEGRFEKPKQKLFEDENILVSVFGERLIFEQKKDISFENLVRKSNFFDFFDIYYQRAFQQGAMKKEIKGDNLYLIIKDISNLEKIIKQTVKDYKLDFQHAYYMILLQDYIARKMYLPDSINQANQTYIYPKYYYNPKKSMSLQEIVFVQDKNGTKLGAQYNFDNYEVMMQIDKDIKLNQSFFDKFPKDKRGLELMDDFIWLQKELFHTEPENLYLGYLFWEKNINSLLNEGVSILGYKITGQEAMKIVGKGFTQGIKLMMDKSYEILENNGISGIQIIHN